MALRFYLDDYDITESIEAQGYLMPGSTSEAEWGIYPGRGSGEWFDLLRVINNNPKLADKFFDGGYEHGTHTLVILDDSGREFNCRIQLRKKYTARNR